MSVTRAYKTDRNSSDTPLAAGATFTGQTDLNDSESVLVWVVTDQDGTLYVEFSTDGTNWDTSLSFNYRTDRINPPHIFEKGYRYYRTRFTNTSASDQTYFRLVTNFGKFDKLTAPINGTLAETYDATTVRPTDYKYEVAMGKRQGRTTWNKFGYNDDVDSASAEVIAEFGGTFQIMTSAEILTVTSTSAQDSQAPATGARTVTIIGIGSDGLSQTETVLMDGTAGVNTSNTWLGVNRVFVTTVGSSGANVGRITFNSATFGTQASVPLGQNVTQQAIFHTQINHNFLVDWLLLNINKLSGGTAPTASIFGYSYSRVTGATYEVFRDTIDTNVENTIQLKPSQPFVVGGREVLYFVAETNTNNTVVRCRFSGIEERVS